MIVAINTRLSRLEKSSNIVKCPNCGFAISEESIVQDQSTILLDKFSLATREKMLQELMAAERNGDK